MNITKVKGHEGWARDTNTGAIINTNSSDIQKAKLLKAKHQERMKNNDQVKQDVIELQDDVKEIKEDLKSIEDKIDALK